MGNRGGGDVGTVRTRMGGRKHRTNVYDACSGGVVVVALGFLVILEAFCKGLERSTQLFIARN